MVLADDFLINSGFLHIYEKSPDFLCGVIKKLQENSRSKIYLTLSEFCAKYQISESTLYVWLEQFEREGTSGLVDANARKHYTKELKSAAVNDYLSGEFSLSAVVRRHDISSHSVIQSWIRKYTSHRELKDTGKRRTYSMTKNIWEERVEIANYCLGKFKYGVSKKAYLSAILD